LKISEIIVGTAIRIAPQKHNANGWLNISHSSPRPEISENKLPFFAAQCRGIPKKAKMFPDPEKI